MGNADTAIKGQTASVSECAAGWIARLQSESCSSEDWSRFRAWRAASPEHDATFNTMMNTWDGLDEFAEDPDIMQMRIDAMSLDAANASRPAWLFPLAACLVLMLAGALALAIPSIYASKTGGDIPAVASSSSTAAEGESLAYTQVYSSGVGQLSTVDLPDGSTIELNTDTVVEIDFTPGQRHLNLVRGEAVFEVAHDADRPFVVQAGDRRITALGTIFSVRKTGQEMIVALIEGSIDVEPFEPGARVGSTAGVRLTPGQQARTAGTARDIEVTKVNVDRALSWRTGRLIFDNDRLADAVAEVNRYSERKLVLADPALADMRISGAFTTGSAEKFAAAISVALPVSLDPRRGGSKLLLRKKPAANSTR
ncbi:FecR family protein [Pseudoblastomonas halimionae]|nr:FecR family protein [Alteriqipengyuania halimionae]